MTDHKVETTKGTPLNAAAQKLVKDLTSWLKQRLWMFAKLPSAFFMGVRVQRLDAQSCAVTVPYGWRSQNPFKSIYFAAQAAAAEMSTGALAMLALQGKGKVSMLVADLKAEFIKKATRKTTFECKAGDQFFEAVDRAIATGEGQTVTVETIGTQPADDGGAPVIVSKFQITWTFKAKRS